MASYKVTAGRSNKGGRSTGSFRVGKRGASDTVRGSVGDVVELNDEQVESLKSAGFSVKEHDGSDDDNGDGSPETPAEQQKAQVASGAQAPPASPKTDNTPGGAQSRARS